MDTWTVWLNTMSENPITMPASPRWRKTTGFWLGIALFLLIVLGPTPSEMTPQAKYMAATVVLMGFWQMSRSAATCTCAKFP